MLSEEKGTEAIIALQAAGGITESEENAKRGWNNLSESEKLYTEETHRLICGGFKEEDNEKPA